MKGLTTKAKRVSTNVGFIGRSLICSTFKMRPRREGEPQPASEECNASKGRNCAEPAGVCQRQHIKRTGEENDTDKKAEPLTPAQRLATGQHKHHHCMDEMVKHSFLPDRPCFVAR